MELKTLTAIVVTAIITAVAKELATVVVIWIKNTKISDSIARVLKPFLNRFFVSVAFDCLGVAAMSGFAVRTFASEAPATKYDLLTLFAICFGLVFFAGSLVYDYFAFLLHRAVTKRHK